MNRHAEPIGKSAQKMGEGAPLFHIGASASAAVEEAQLVANFQQLDGYGRRVALAMLCSLARLKGAAC